MSSFAMTKIVCGLAAVCFILGINAGDVAAWTMKKAPLMTKWSMEGTTVKIDPAKVWPLYPRMQMRRPATWQSLNGIWQFQKAANETEALPTGNLSGDILVPFPVESPISGVMGRSIDYQYVWYRKIIAIPAEWRTGKKILVHFEAVDWKTEVFINGKSILVHSGGYDRFSVDITPHLVAGDQVLTLRVFDPTDLGNYNPSGKQRVSPGGICYTGSVGIWGPAWMEAVPATAYINNLKIVPDVDNQSVKISVSMAGDPAGAKIYAFAKDKQRGMWGADSVNATATTNLTIKLSAVNLWWPDRPFLYDLGIYMKKGGVFVDSVQSYFGMRKVESKAFNNQKRITINGQPIFVFGPLDQGFWPDGNYTAPCEEALRYDLEMMKAWGMNGMRKHVKIELDRWYYYCDSLGLMVLQDMVDVQAGSSPQGYINFMREFDSLVVQKYNHPSIVEWIAYNLNYAPLVHKNLCINSHL